MTDGMIFWMISLPWLLSIILITASDLPQQYKLVCSFFDIFLLAWVLLFWRTGYCDYCTREQNAADFVVGNAVQQADAEPYEPDKNFIDG
jgi:hypothetical protein